MTREELAESLYEYSVTRQGVLSAPLWAALTADEKDCYRFWIDDIVDKRVL